MNIAILFRRVLDRSQLQTAMMTSPCLKVSVQEDLVSKESNTTLPPISSSQISLSRGIHTIKQEGQVERIFMDCFMIIQRYICYSRITKSKKNHQTTAITANQKQKQTTSESTKSTPNSPQSQPTKPALFPQSIMDKLTELITSQINKIQAIKITSDKPQTEHPF